jgi:peptidoglycan/xylan/chitin deacetylase (PgdA/CDA1 family)
MEPVPLIFSCDTEDYETPASDDAELLWARMFARHGIKACFCVVGEEARALRDRGRRDVLAALAGHEIASHSDLHSAHPTPAEYLEELSWAEGVQHFLAEEGKAVRDLGEILGQEPSAWCKPGNSWGAAVPYAAGLLGMPVFCDAPFEWAPGHPMRFAGGLLLRYHTSFDRYFDVPAGERFERMRSDFEDLLAARQADAEGDGLTPGVVVMYTHPCRTVTAAFPSNFTAGKRTPRSSWQPAPLRRPEEAEALRRDFDAFLRWIVELRTNGRIVLTTYRELDEAHRQPPAPWLPLEDVLALARPLAEDEAPLEPRRPGGQGEWLSPAEQFGVLVWALARRAVGGDLPAEVPVRRLLGPLDPGVGAPGGGPNNGAGEGEPAGAPTAGEVVAAAGAASEACSTGGAVPLAVRVGTANLGPGRFLRLAARTLVVLAGGGAPDAPAAVPAGGDAAALAGREDFVRLRFRGTWSVFPPEFEGQRLLEQARWQTWSATPA